MKGRLIIWLWIACMAGLTAGDLPKRFVLTDEELKQFTPEEGKELVRSLPADHALISGDRDKVKEWFSKPTIYLGHYGPKGDGKFRPEPIDLLEQKAVAYYILHGGKDFQVSALRVALKVSYSFGAIEKSAATVFATSKGKVRDLAAKIALRKRVTSVYPRLRAHFAKLAPSALGDSVSEDSITSFSLLYREGKRDELKAFAKAAAPVLTGDFDANVRMSMAQILYSINSDDKPVPDITRVLWKALVDELRREKRDEAVCQRFIHCMRRPHMTAFPREHSPLLLEIALFDANDKVAKQAARLRVSVLRKGRLSIDKQRLDIYLPLMHHATSLDKAVAARASGFFNGLGQDTLIEIAKLVDGSSASFSMTRNQASALADKLLPMRISWAMEKKANYVTHAEKKKAEAAYWKEYKPKVYKKLKVSLADE